MRRLLTPEVERKLQLELTALWNSRDPVYTHKQIAKKLKFGVKGTPYEALRERHVTHYQHRFHLPGRARILFSHKYKPPKKAKKKKKNTCELHETKVRVDALERAQRWSEFDGSWKEFRRKIRAEEREMNINGISTPSTT